MKNGKFEIKVSELRQIIKEEAMSLKIKMLAEAKTRKKLAILESKKADLLRQLNECGGFEEEHEELDEGLWDTIKDTASNIKGNITKDPAYLRRVFMDDMFAKIGKKNSEDGKWLSNKKGGPWSSKFSFDRATLNSILLQAEADNWGGILAPKGSTLGYKTAAQIGSGGGNNFGGGTSF